MTLSKLNPEHIIKSIYSSPFNMHKNDSGLVLDISYITDNIVVCSYPVMKYPKMFYRNSLADLVTYLDGNHGRKNWKIYNLKAESNDSDYTDEDFAMLLGVGKVSTVDGSGTPTLRSRRMLEEHCRMSGMNSSPVVTIRSEKVSDVISTHLLRAGWTDHCPPPFIHLQNLIADLKIHISSGKIAVVHCRMGKGRSGTLVIAYLMTCLQLPRYEAQSLFLSTRFKVGIKRGVTISSQVRCLKYQEMFLRYELSERSLILETMPYMKFKLISIEFSNPIGKLSAELFKKTPKTTVSIKIQTHSENNMELVELFSKYCHSRNDTLRSLTDKYIIVPNIIVPVPDIQLCFGLFSRTSSFINNVSHLSSFSSCWLNLYWEAVLQARSLDGERNFILPKNERFIYTIRWNELDGLKGLSGKGLKLFDSVSITWLVT